VHRLTNPVLYRLEEVLACWKAITAPVLWIEAKETNALRRMGTPQEARAEIDRRLRCIPNVSTAAVADAGHMLQHDQPEALAVLIEDFLR
jgi:pimeloyl-ACP methyl ester carboxylesterase